MSTHEIPQTCPICDFTSLRLIEVTHDRAGAYLRFECRECRDDELMFIIEHGADYWGLTDEQCERRDAREDGAPVQIVWGDRLIDPEHPVYAAALRALRDSPDGVIYRPASIIRPNQTQR